MTPLILFFPFFVSSKNFPLFLMSSLSTRNSTSFLDQIFALSAVALLVFCLLWVWKDLNPEWLPYQKQYRQLAQELVTDENYRRSILEEKIEIKQFIIPSLGKVDRCTTCHRAYDNEAFTNVAQPLTYHAELLDSHPPEKYGCTICHLSHFLPSACSISLHK